MANHWRPNSELKGETEEMKSPIYRLDRLDGSLDTRTEDPDASAPFSLDAEAVYGRRGKVIEARLRRWCRKEQSHIANAILIADGNAALGLPRPSCATDR